MMQAKKLLLTAAIIFSGLLFFALAQSAKAQFFSDCTSYDPPNSYCSSGSVCTGTGEREVGAGSMQECNGNACCIRPASVGGGGTADYTGGRVSGTCPGGSCRSTCRSGETVSSVDPYRDCKVGTEIAFCCVPSGSTAGETGGYGLPVSDTPGGNGASTATTAPAATACPGGELVGGFCVPANTGLADPQGGLVAIIFNFLNWLLVIFGFVALVGFLVSGIQYIVAAGNEGIMETAKRNMTYSIIGVIVGLSGVVIINAVTAALSASSPFF